MSKVLHVLQKPPRVWLMVAKAFFWSAWYRWHILYRPFSELSEKIGTFQQETPEEPLDETRVREVKFAVVGVCRHTPWESMCLVQALTAKKLLNQAGLPCTLYMGVRRNQDQKMVAHAWLRCGNRYVTGGNGSLYYAITGKYADLA